MPSPFPGIDPYIEAQQRWHSFHTSYIVACAEALNQGLPHAYYATVEERILIDAGDPSESRRVAYRLDPDAAIVRATAQDAGPSSPSKGSNAATLTPKILPQSIISVDQPTQKFVEIRSLPDHELVTTLELLSPTNKRSGDDRSAYLTKRADLLRHGINVVDLDLLLQGQRLTLLVPLPPGDCHAFVTRAANFKECQVYSWTIRDVLPAIGIPLKGTDPDIELNLQQAFTQVYDRNRYDMLLRYNRQLPEFLNDDDRKWTEQLVRPR